MVGGEVFFCGVGVVRVRVGVLVQVLVQVQGWILVVLVLVLVLFRCWVGIGEGLVSLVCLGFGLALVLAEVALVVEEVLPRGSGPGFGIPG